MTNQPHILVVEDDPEISKLLTRYLRSNDMRVMVATDGSTLGHLLNANRFDLILLDIMLPGEDGLSLCRHIRATSSIPIIITSARGDDLDRIIGLEFGADDYVPKPFNPRELLARIRAVLRRVTATPPLAANKTAQDYRFRGFTLNKTARTVTNADGARLSITSAEFDLLLVFCDRPGMTLSRDQLIDLTQGRAAGPLERSIDILVSRLRSKIDPGDGHGPLIATVRSSGYQFTPVVTVS